MWDLYEKYKGKCYHACRGVSGDSCKRAAKRAAEGCRPSTEWLIRDPSGKDWMKSVPSGSWRMKWEYVKGESHDRMDVS
jgi:hypothetical protein